MTFEEGTSTHLLLLFLSGVGCCVRATAYVGTTLQAGPDSAMGYKGHRNPLCAPDTTTLQKLALTMSVARQFLWPFLFMTSKDLCMMGERIHVSNENPTKK